jgi:anaerobic selenocysteine-containing dehydrogenase
MASINGSEMSGNGTSGTAYRTCPLCEAGCGLEITVKNGSVTRIRGDMDDVFSRGYICPKGSTLKQLHDDPDRLRRPLVKRDGVHVEVEWDEAWREVERGLGAVIAQHGRNAVATYMGNPSAHNLGSMTFGRVALQGIGTRQRYSASSVDQAPKQLTGGLMFGTVQSVPIPDIDHTHYLLMLGANPYASNGSLCTAPDFPGRLEAILSRGGKVVVVDPRRSETAQKASEWLPIIPNGDALFLAAIANVLFADELVSIGDHVAPHLNGLADVRDAVSRFTPEAVERACGIDAKTIRRIAHELANAPSATVYGRIGTTTTAFGSTTSWLVDVVNTLTGNLDSEGGSLFTLPAAGGATTKGQPGRGKGFQYGKGTSRVKGLPEVMGEFPVAVLADEILTAGEGQIRAMVTLAGNPVLSNPNSGKLDKALASLEFMVSVDIYLNETTRHADVILPPPSHLQRDHYDVFLLAFAVRNVANYSPAVLPLDAGQPDEWEILAKLGMIAQGAGADADPAVADDVAIAALVGSAVRDPSSNVCGRDADELLAELSKAGRRGPARMVDFMLRTGPYGDAFGAAPDGLSLEVLLANPHGIDLGALRPRIPEVIRTASGKIELAPAQLLADVERLWQHASNVDDEKLMLVGRRHIRSNNSWMHNISVLVKGKPRCTLQMNPNDAVERGIAAGQSVRVKSRVGEVLAPVEITDDIRPGVVSLPHGWGHSVAGTRLSVAGEFAGVNSNLLTDEDLFDPISGTSVLNGIPVAVSVA